MHNIKKITNDLFWVGANDRRLAMFEGVYSVPRGVSYNAYLLLDNHTVLFDTVDKAVTQKFIENINHVLGNKKLDYLIVQHMEPDHSLAIKTILEKFPQVKIVANEKTLTMIKQFYQLKIDKQTIIVKEGDSLNTGRHTLHFVMAPMVHWPEVMVTYDANDKILFSADGFGCFGALNGALYADEVDFNHDYMDEARRYYTNIVGKYGIQVQTLLQKAATLEINMICPLHGFVWRKNISDFIHKYHLWSSYEPEEYGVMIAYASVYGNTENAAEILASLLRNKGIKTVMFDVSVTPASEIIAAAFQWSHLVFASTTYNAGIFITMDELLSDLVAHNIQNRTIALIENGSWAPTSGDLMRKKLQDCKNVNILPQIISLQSALKEEQINYLETLANHLIDTFPKKCFLNNQNLLNNSNSFPPLVDPNALFKISYGLFVLITKNNDKNNGCIINTVAQVTNTPLQISITVNKANYSHDLILKTKTFNISILTEDTPFRIFKQFGFNCGKDCDKFAGISHATSANGLRYLTEFANAALSASVTQIIDCGTHTLFIAEITETLLISQAASATYQYYFDHIKPKPAPQTEKKTGWVCKICGYFHAGEHLDSDFICPLCKHGIADFEFVKAENNPNKTKTNRYICKICGYIYEGDELPLDFICPICKHGASDFEKMND